MQQTFVFLYLAAVLLVACQQRPEMLTESIATAVIPNATPQPEATKTAVATVAQPVVVDANNVPSRLELAEHPPSPTPYHIEEDDFWLVHTPDGQLMAFVPIAPTYAPHVTVDECRYAWIPANQRFEDPCSGDKWELDGRLNVEASFELWSSRDLDQYRLAVMDGAIFVQKHQLIEGTPLDPQVLAQDSQYGVEITAVSADFSPTATTINLLTQIDPIWQINPNVVPPQQALIYPVFPASLVDDQGRELAPTASSTLGAVYDPRSGSVQQQSQMTWEGVADGTTGVVAALNVQLDNLLHEATFPLDWAAQQADAKWPVDIRLEIGHTAVQITDVEWLETLADGNAHLRLTLVDASPPDIRLYCLVLATTEPPLPSECPNFEGEASFDIVAEPAKPISVQLRTSLELLTLFHLNLPVETAVTGSRPVV